MNWFKISHGKSWCTNHMYFTIVFHTMKWKIDVEINFTYEIFISRIESEQFTRERLFSYLKLHVKFL